MIPEGGRLIGQGDPTLYLFFSTEVLIYRKFSTVLNVFSFVLSMLRQRRVQ